MLFFYIFKRIIYKILQLTLNLILTGGMLMISLFCTPHQNIKRPSEIFEMFEKQNRMSVPQVQIIRENKTFTTFVHRKPTFSEVCTYFDNF